MSYNGFCKVHGPWQGEQCPLCEAEIASITATVDRMETIATQPIIVQSDGEFMKALLTKALVQLELMRLFVEESIELVQPDWQAPPEPKTERDQAAALAVGTVNFFFDGLPPDVKKRAMDEIDYINEMRKESIRLQTEIIKREKMRSGR
jgi:hypothetical protein